MKTSLKLFVNVKITLLLVNKNIIHKKIDKNILKQHKKLLKHRKLIKIY